MGSRPSDSWQPPQVTLETSMGDITIELYWNHAPHACRNFAELSRCSFYDKCTFHRVIRRFLIQSGDPTATGKGGVSICGTNFADEINPDLKFTGAGVVACANCGQNTGGSQFFISLAPLQHLDGKYPIFGRVSSGMDVVKRISLVQVENDVPTKPIVINRTSIIDY